MHKWYKTYTGAIVFSSILCLILGGLLSFLALGPDFVAPNEKQESSVNGAVWEKSYDDLVAYLDELGYIDGNSYDLISEGVATEARVYGEVEIYWWDVDNLVEGSDVHTSWVSMQEEGYILLYGQFIFVPQMNGPFGINVHDEFYAGDADGLRDAFAAFPGEE